MKPEEIFLSLSLVAILVIYILSRHTSYASEQVPANCNSKAIDAKLPCITAYPDYPFAGDIINGGKQKFCCKSK